MPTRRFFFDDSVESVGWPAAGIAKLGATQEGILRKHMVLHGGTYVRNCVYFSVLDDEWPAVEQGLLTRLDMAAPPRPVK